MSSDRVAEAEDGLQATINGVQLVAGGSGRRNIGGCRCLAEAVETDTDRLVEMLLWHGQRVVGTVTTEHLTTAPDVQTTTVAVTPSSLITYDNTAS